MKVLMSVSFIARAVYSIWAITTTSSSARARRAPCSPTASRGRPRTACCCWRPAARISRPGAGADRLRPHLQRSALQLDVRGGGGCGARRPPTMCRAVRCLAGRARSTRWCTCAGNRATSTTGAAPATPAGRGGGAAVLPDVRGPRARRRWFHGAGGPLHVTDVSPTPTRSVARLSTPARTRRRPHRDFNGAHTEGAGLWQVTIKDGVRVSAPRRSCGR